jgi:hypothetical protein
VSWSGFQYVNYTVRPEGPKVQLYPSDLIKAMRNQGPGKCEKGLDIAECEGRFTVKCSKHFRISAKVRR